VLLGADERPAWVDGAAQELAAGAAAVEQQAQEGRLADLLRGGQERDCLLGEHALPDPRDGPALLLHAGGTLTDGAVLVGHGCAWVCAGVQNSPAQGNPCRRT